MAKYRQLFTTIYYSATLHSEMNVHGHKCFLLLVIIDNLMTPIIPGTT